MSSPAARFDSPRTASGPIESSPAAALASYPIQTLRIATYPAVSLGSYPFGPLRMVADRLLPYCSVPIQSARIASGPFLPLRSFPFQPAPYSSAPNASGAVEFSHSIPIGSLLFGAYRFGSLPPVAFRSDRPRVVSCPIASRVTRLSPFPKPRRSSSSGIPPVGARCSPGRARIPEERKPER